MSSTVEFSALVDSHESRIVVKLMHPDEVQVRISADELGKLRPHVSRRKKPMDKDYVDRP